MRQEILLLHNLVENPTASDMDAIVQAMVDGTVGSTASRLQHGTQRTHFIKGLTLIDAIRYLGN